MTTSTHYPLGLRNLIEKRIGYLTDDVKAMLTTSGYTPQDSHQYLDQVSNEVTGTGYTSGGQSLTTKTITHTGTAIRLTCDNPSWTGTFTARRLVVYVDTGDAATSPLLLHVDFETDQVVNNEAFTYVLPTTGLVEYFN